MERPAFLRVEFLVAIMDCLPEDDEKLYWKKILSD
jgi:hypothetical protein